MLRWRGPTVSVADGSAKEGGIIRLRVTLSEASDVDADAEVKLSWYTQVIEDVHQRANRNSDYLGNDAQGSDRGGGNGGHGPVVPGAG